jgi:hypothetical protein
VIQRRKKRERQQVQLVSRIEQFRTTAPVGQSGAQWTKERAK